MPDTLPNNGLNQPKRKWVRDKPPIQYRGKLAYGLKTTPLDHWTPGIRKTFAGPWRHENDRRFWETKAYSRAFAYPLIEATARRLGMRFEEVRRIIEVYGDECWEAAMVGKGVACFGGFTLFIVPHESGSRLCERRAASRMVRARVLLDRHFRPDAAKCLRPQPDDTRIQWRKIRGQYAWKFSPARHGRKGDLHVVRDSEPEPVPGPSPAGRGPEQS